MKKLFFLLGIVPAVFGAPIEIQQFDNAQQEADYRSLIQELRCPQCQNNNIADSNATIATDMRNKTLELLKQGKNKQEVVDYMIERYGNFVTYNPPLTPATLFLWLLPAMLIVLGVGLMFSQRKKSVQADGTAAKSAKSLDEVRLAKILNEKE